MNRTLLRKELRQHGVWLAAMVLATGGIFLLVVFASNADGSGAGVFFGIGQGLSYFLPLPCFLVCHLLVATEFRRKTRLFLEGLPLPRWRLIAVKAAVTLAVVLAMACGAVAAGALVSAGAEAMTPRFLGILLLSASVWAAFLAGLFFLISFFGRYKVAILLVLIFGLSWVNYATAVPLRDFPPFALLHRFGFERELWPAREALLASGIALACFASAFVLGLAKEGSVAAILGERMNYREKMFIGTAATIVFSAAMLWYAPPAEPFDLPGAVREEFDGMLVHLSPEDRDRPVDEEVALAAYLARRLAEKRDWLGIPAEEFPPVFIVERTGMGEDNVESEPVEGDRAVLMFADYRSPGFSREALMAYSMSTAMEVHTLGRASLDSRWWIVCGIEGLFEMEGADEEARAARERLAYDTVQEHGFGLDRLLGRGLLEKEAGWREADAVAWMAFRHLAETVGMEKVQALARATLARRVSRKDSRPSWRDLARPVPRIFRETTGLGLEAFAEGAQDYILAHPGGPAKTEATEQPEQREDDD